MASITCECGNVTIAFPTDHCRICIQCCCCDCHEKHELAASNGGPSLKDDHINLEKPLCGEMWDAKITVVDGEEYLGFNKLHAKAASTNCVATCCSNILFVDHSNYKGNCVLVFPEFVKMKGATHPHAPVLTTFYKDWPEKHQEKLDFSDIPGAYFENGELRGSGDYVGAVTQLMGSFEIPPEGKGKSFEELLEKRGGQVVDLGCKPRTCHHLDDDEM